jgi:outer membrane protein
VASAEKQVGISKGGYAPIVSLAGQINSNAAQDRLRTTESYTGYLPIGTLTPGGTDYVYTINQQEVPLAQENYPFFDQFNDNINQFVGVNLQIPLFNRLNVRTSVQNAELQLEQARLQLEVQKNSLRQTIERAYADAQASMKNYMAAQKSLEANEESWAYAKKRFEEGAMNIFDYENTRNRYLNATAQMLQSKYDYIFKIKVLEFYLTNAITL